MGLKMAMVIISTSLTVLGRAQAVIMLICTVLITYFLLSTVSGGELQEGGKHVFVGRELGFKLQMYPTYDPPHMHVCCWMVRRSHTPWFLVCTCFVHSSILSKNRM
jgi:hypothetical protein